MYLRLVDWCRDALLVLSVLDFFGAIGTPHGATVSFRVLPLCFILLTRSEVAFALTVGRLFYGNSVKLLTIAAFYFPGRRVIIGSPLNGRHQRGLNRCQRRGLDRHHVGPSTSKGQAGNTEILNEEQFAQLEFQSFLPDPFLLLRQC